MWQDTVEGSGIAVNCKAADLFLPPSSLTPAVMEAKARAGSHATGSLSAGCVRIRPELF
jgi:hypothetical protein